MALQVDLPGETTGNDVIKYPGFNSPAMQVHQGVKEECNFL